MRRVFIEPGAKADVLSAFAYYEESRAGLGLEFKGRIVELLLLVSDHPLAFPELEPGVRWGLAKQFPFKVFFLPEEDPIRVIAVSHAAAHPDAWKKRI